MRAKAILCIPIGHRWTAAPDSASASPLFICARCGRAQELGAAGAGPFDARVGAETGRDNAVGPFGPRR